MTIERVNKLVDTYLSISKNVTIVEGRFVVDAGISQLVIIPNETGYDVSYNSVSMPITTVQQVMDIFANPSVIISQLIKQIN